ncbi:hypothetical protein ACH5RR_008829 [Cinchona calisaya]|uniref:CCHC-type domain-containing protein n=1 Tax=Cinchona calisaya TaxID=153742 RepID=A0ABD3AFG8_9GENT
MDYHCLGAGHYANKCPNKRVPFMQGNEVVSKGSEDEDDTMPKLEIPSDDEDYEQEDLSQIPTLIVLWAFTLRPRMTKMRYNEFKDVFPEEISLAYCLPGVLSTKLILSLARSSITNPPIKPI